MTRDQKIQQIADLLSGKITKEDFKPKETTILINWGISDDGIDMNLYMVGGAVVDREAYNRALKKLGKGIYTVSYE